MHQNYVGIDSEKNPYFLSIVSQESGNKSTPLYRAMLFRKQVSIIFKHFKLRLPYASRPCVELKTKIVFYCYHAACSRMLNYLCENKRYLLLSKLENVFLAEIADYHLFVWMRPWHASHCRWTWYFIQFVYSISCQMNDNDWIKYWYK